MYIQDSLFDGELARLFDNNNGQIKGVRGTAAAPFFCENLLSLLFSKILRKINYKNWQVYGYPFLNFLIASAPRCDMSIGLSTADRSLVPSNGLKYTHPKAALVLTS